jgi:hypothetical protein
VIISVASCSFPTSTVLARWVSQRVAPLADARIDLRQGLSECIAQGHKPFRTDSLLTSSQTEEGIEHHVRIPEQVDQVVASENSVHLTRGRQRIGT